jgi:hypothetical protein
MAAGGLAVPFGLYFGYPLVAAIGTAIVVLGKFGVPYFDKKAEREDEQNAADEKTLASSFLRVSYHRTVSNRGNGSIIVAFENTGNGPIQYFTADIKSNGGNFQIGQTIRVTTSGIGGSWTTISGTNLLPQERASVLLSFVDPDTTLKPPEIKSDSRYEFVGERAIEIGPFVRVENGGFVEATIAPPAPK